MGLWSIFIMGLVGGFIGWMTNFFAIGMLFRPYEPIKLGKFQLPFTPGVIPKRRKEIAKSIGRIVGHDLIHADKMTAQIFNPKVRQQLGQILEGLIEQAFVTQHTPKEFCIKYFGIRAEQIKQTEQRVIERVQQEADKMFLRTLKSVLEDTAGVKKEVLLEKVSAEIQKLLAQAMDEPSFRRVLIEKVGDFISGLGFVAKVVTQVVQTETIADKIISGIQPYTRSETVYTFIYRGLEQAWMKYENRSVGSLLDEFDLLSKERVHQGIEGWLRQNNPLDKPIAELLRPFDAASCTALGMQMTDFLFESEYVHQFVQKSLNQFDFQKLIEDEINRLSLPELEMKIYEIASRELFMIQLLGGVLGTLIGVVQALMFLYVF